MSKAVLVLDAPNKCIECPLSYDVLNDYNKNICRGCEKYMFNQNSDTKPDWCPLREVPNRKEHDIDNNRSKTGYVWGWNDCLREILGE